MTCFLIPWVSAWLFLAAFGAIAAFGRNVSTLTAAENQRAKVLAFVIFLLSICMIVGTGVGIVISRYMK